MLKDRRMIDAIQRNPAASTVTVSPRATNAIEVMGQAILRYGLVLLLLGSGLAKFTEAEALWIQPLLANSPLSAWIYGVTSVQGASNIIGVVEIVLAGLIAVRRWWPGLCAIGSLGAAVTFLFTFSFVFTTPGQSVELTGFLVKDLILLGAALWSAGEALRARSITS
jgi:reactive chlorine resistance protein C